MGKRSLEPDETEQSHKRSKHGSHHQTEEIHTSRQLQDLLSFRQDSIQQLRHGISSFKAFLENTIYHKEEGNQAHRVMVLREYLHSQKPNDIKNLERPFLAQLWQAWSFANQNNNDHLASAVAAILALLAKTLSSLLEFKEHGYLFCRTVLQHQHLRLVKRGLNAPKHKDFVISPCLRLLIEVVSFDGGQLAREVYKRREETFDTGSVRRNLMLGKSDSVDDADSHRKLSVRTLAVRYVLAHLGYQDLGAKQDILKQRPICGALFQHLRDDPADLISELLKTTEQHVLKDAELQRSSKASLLTSQNLDKVLEVATRSSREDGTPEVAFKWLKGVCSTPSYGVLRSSGFYPPGFDGLEERQRSGNAIDIGLDSIPSYDQGERQIRNTTLQHWVQNLRPQSDLQERELVLTCFEAAPELVAAYFQDKKIQLEPKLTNTWIGYASFLFEIARQPLPMFAGYTDAETFAQLPPQVSIVMESVLPRPLTQDVLTRCLRQSSDLITFFAVRILVLAFQKLAEVRQQLEAGAKASDRPDLWQEAIERLEAAFIARSPAMKDVIVTFRKLPADEEHLAQREATTRLLRLYYEALPLSALEAQFEVSTALTSALNENEPEDAEGGFKALTLEHLLACAKHSPSMQWFTKQGSLRFAPIVTLLQLHVKDHRNRNTRELLNDVLVENSILNNRVVQTSVRPVEILIASLLHSNSDAVYDLLHECFSRISKGPIKYQDDLDELGTDDVQASRLPSLLVPALAEQIPHAMKKSERERQSVIEWTTSFVDMYHESGLCDQTLMAALQSQLVATGAILAKKSSKKRKNSSDGNHTELLQKVRLDDSTRPDQEQQETGIPSQLPFERPPTESDSYPELTRWQNKDLEIAIEDGDLSALMLCLCSQHADIRIQAQSKLRGFIAALEASSLEEKAQLRILIGELLETFEQLTTSSLNAEEGNQALPYIAGVFAARAAAVLTDPTHFIYAKLNRYLMRGPRWNVRSLASYWIRDTVLGQPDEGDAYWKEVQWVLDWLVDGVRTEPDVKLVLRQEVIEKLLALYSSPSASRTLVKSKVLELLHRVISIDAVAPVTRAGVLSWLDMAKLDSELAGLVREDLKSKIDPQRFTAWSGVPVEAA